MKKTRIYAVNANQFVSPNPQTLLTQTTRWLTNGPDNSYFYTVEKAYLGSPTNQAIIDNYANYILGEGLYDKMGIVNVENILSEEDQRLAFTDFKLQGACAFQVIYNLGGKISKLYYLPTKSLAIDRMQDITDEPEAYWYSFDWLQKTKFKPVKYPAFGKGQELETEILYIKRQSPQPLFALPDWQSGIQYCQTEEQLSNYYINHIKNNFSAGKIVNINQGIPANEEAQEEAEIAIKNQLTGTSNAGQIIVSFNDNKDNATTVENIEITDAYSQFQFLSTECVDKIMLAHKVNDKSLFGFNNASGFSSNAEQMAQSLKILYRSQINPMRKILIKGLEEAFKTIDPRIELAFKDFEELQVTETQPQNMAQMKISFDFDGTANTEEGRKMVQMYTGRGMDVYIISARRDDYIIKDYARKVGIPANKVFAMGNNAAKIQKVKDLGITRHFDDNQDVVGALPGVGVKMQEIENEGFVEFKKWRSNPNSSNVDRIMYNDETSELVIKFHGGSTYTYYDVDFGQFTEIFQGAGICRTEGENRWGTWWVGKTPSVGAAVYEILVRSGVRYSRGGSLR